MITRKILPLLFAIFLIACKQNVTPFVREYLTESKLTNQVFTIDPTRDTLLLSQSGIRIHVAQGTFSGANAVTIEFKEALDFESILQAGLFTTSNGKALSSAGMFYLNTKENLAIEKPIGIQVPASTALDGMKLFKGEEVDGKINWEDPQPVAVVPAVMGGIDGKALFKNNCASCHGIDKNLTGPALAGVRQRWQQMESKRKYPVNTTGSEIDTDSSIAEHYHNALYDFTRNPASSMAHGVNSGYLRCLKCQFNGAMMTAFPLLSDSDLDGLYKYIDDETERLGLDPKQFESACDSCSLYQLEYEQLRVKRDRLSQANGSSVATENENMPLPNFVPITIEVATDTQQYRQQVTAVPKNADYYKITIKETGWYNIDILLAERINVSESMLMVRLQGVYEKQFQVFLAIPSSKVFAEGGYLENGKELGFKYADGTLPLPQNVEALVFVMGEEKGKFYFAKQWFTTKTNQTINLDVQALTKTNFEIEIHKIQLPDLNFAIDTSVNSSGLKEVDAKIEKLKMDYSKKCDCAADTLVYDFFSPAK